MALFRLLIEEIQLTFKRFPFHCHVQVFSCKISTVCRLKYAYSCFSSYFCFLFIVVLCVLMLLLLQLIAVISFYSLFLMYSLSLHATTLYSMLVNPLSPFLDTYSLSTPSLGYKANASSPIFLPICLSFSFVRFKNGPVYLTRRTAHVFIPLVRFLQLSMVSRNFIVPLRNSFFSFFISYPLISYPLISCPLPIFPSS